MATAAAVQEGAERAAQAVAAQLHEHHVNRMAAVTLPSLNIALVATHQQKRQNTGQTEYRVYRGWAPLLGTTLFWLEGSSRSPNNHGNPPGPQHYMQTHASTQRHTMCVAFDVPTRVAAAAASQQQKQRPATGSGSAGARVTKAFASYADDRALYTALFNSDLRQRLLPQGTPNTSYEIVREGKPCWPHFDIEWDPAVHKVEQPAELVLLFMDLVLNALRQHYQFKCATLGRRHFRVSRSRNSSAKCSYHLILRGGVAFADSHVHMHAFMQTFFRELVLGLVLDNDERLRPLFFDRSAIKVKVGGGCIMDTQIYTRNREFRICGAVKLMAPDRVLVPYDLERGSELLEPDALSYEQWSEYLAGNVPSDLDDMHLLQATEAMLALAKSKTPPVSINSVEQEALECHFIPEQQRSTSDDELRASGNRSAAPVKRRAPPKAAVPQPPPPKRAATQHELDAARAAAEAVNLQWRLASTSASASPTATRSSSTYSDSATNSNDSCCSSREDSLSLDTRSKLASLRAAMFGSNSSRSADALEE